MEDIVWLLITALGSAVSYFLGSMASPHAKAYKVQAQTWQGQYSGLKKQLMEVQGIVDEQDPILALGKQFGLDAKTTKMLVPLVKPYIEQFLKQKLDGAGKDATENWR